MVVTLVVCNYPRLSVITLVTKCNYPRFTLVTENQLPSSADKFSHGDISMKTPIKHKILLQVNQKLNYEHVSTTKPLYNGQVLAWYRKNFLNRRQDGRHLTRVIYYEGNSKCYSVWYPFNFMVLSGYVYVSDPISFIR